jgi:hypothetical protein
VKQKSKPLASPAQVGTQKKHKAKQLPLPEVPAPKLGRPLTDRVLWTAFLSGESYMRIEAIRADLNISRREIIEHYLVLLVEGL